MPTLADYIGTRIAEAPESPQWVDGEQPSLVRTYHGVYDDLIAAKPAIGSINGGWVVKQVAPQQMPGRMGRMVVTYTPGGAASGADLPEDEAELTPMDLQPRIERHPRYEDIDDDVMGLVRQAVDSPEKDKRTDAASDLLLESEAAALELVRKLIRGQETYYLSGYTYTWTSYHWTMPPLTNGGIIQTPGGPFAALLSTLTDFSWLRQADTVASSRPPYKVTRTWLGGPGGHWDADLYPAG